MELEDALQVGHVNSFLDKALKTLRCGILFRNSIFDKYGKKAGKVLRRLQFLQIFASHLHHSVLPLGLEPRANHSTEFDDKVIPIVIVAQEGVGLRASFVARLIAWGFDLGFSFGGCGFGQLYAATRFPRRNGIPEVIIQVARRCLVGNKWQQFNQARLHPLQRFSYLFPILDVLHRG